MGTTCTSRAGVPGRLLPRTGWCDTFHVSDPHSGQAEQDGRIGLTRDSLCSRLESTESVTDREELQAELDPAQVDGLVVEVEEFQLRSASLAAPVHNRTGAVVGAIAVSVKAAQFEHRHTHLEHVARHGATQASALLTDTDQAEAIVNAARPH